MVLFKILFITLPKLDMVSVAHKPFGHRRDGFVDYKVVAVMHVFRANSKTFDKPTVQCLPGRHQAVKMSWVSMLLTIMKRLLLAR